MSEIVGYIMQFTNYALIELDLPWDSYTFTLWDVIVFQIFTYIVIMCFVVLFRAFSNRVSEWGIL